MNSNEYEQIEASLRLLEATHDFPCDFMVKVIGRTEDDFVARVVLVIRECQQSDQDPPFRVRQTPNGRHVAVTLHPHVESAAEVLAIYREIRDIRGVVLLM